MSSDLLATFASWVERRPDAVAVGHRGTTTSYVELDAMVERLAGGLAQLGVGPGSRVGLMPERSRVLPAAVFAVLRTGAAYVPLNPADPIARSAMICADAEPALVLSSERLRGSVPETGAPVATIEDLLGADPPAWRRPQGDATAPAYVLYTSGTTGIPKGVVVECGSVAAFVASTISAYGLGPKDRVLGFAELSFDVSVLEIFCALGAGASLHVADREQRLDPEELTELIAGESLTVADIPPVLLPFLEAERMPGVRLVSVGGESFAAALARPWVASGRRFVNSYGPTEATVAVTLHECTGEEPGSAPIGVPMPGQRVHLLDDAGEPVADGEQGEIHITGSQVARGYLNRPEQTGLRFLPNPFAGTPGARMFRTGDLARRNEAGELEFLGRADRQVKIRGVRIELAEVEQALSAHDDVVRAAVVVRRTGTGLGIVGFAVLAPEVDGERLDLTAHLSTRLPSHAVPKEIRAVPRLPLTANGKVDFAELESWTEG